MVFTGVMGVILTYFKSVISFAVSVLIALNAVLTGPMGEYTKLSLKLWQTNPMKTEIDFSVYVNTGEINSLLSENAQESTENQEFNFESGINVYSDIDNLRFMLELENDESKDYKLYLDTEAVALSPDATKDILSKLGEFSEDDISLSEVYDKYFDDYSFYFDFAELESDFTSEDTEIFGIYEEVFAAMQSDGFMSKLVDMYKKQVELTSEYYSTERKNGTNVYTYKVSGKELLKLYSGTFEMLATPEYVDSIISLAATLYENIDYEKLATKYDLGMTAQEVKELVQTEIDEQAKEELIASYAELNMLLQPYLQILITGENADVLGEFKAVIPYLEHSYESSSIYEKDGKIYQESELVIADSDTVLASIKINQVSSEYNGEIPAASVAAPFGKRATTELIDNKLGFEKAQENGVSSVYIEWFCEMTPEDVSPRISENYFCVEYDKTYKEYYESDESLTDDERKALISENGEEKLSGEIKESTAYLIEDRVYLPLRQLMENAGYEVSWNNDERKAYVTVGTEKIEMTGTIINDKTYVKVRDFEKLGAKVEYDEYIYETNAYNDFSKSCYAAIIFEK